MFPNWYRDHTQNAIEPCVVWDCVMVGGGWSHEPKHQHLTTWLLKSGYSGWTPVVTDIRLELEISMISYCLMIYWGHFMITLNIFLSYASFGRHDYW